MSEQHTTHSNTNMIIGAHSHPTVHIPGDPTANIHSPFSTEIDDYDIPMDAFTSDHFRIYVFKVKKCASVKSHDWIDCPYAHPGEKARRRDPRKFRYSGTACPDYKKGECVRGDACAYAHGVFECWLHPTRYRTQPCKDGVLCRRKICFFAHTADQLRLLPTGSLRNCDGFVTELDDELPSRLGGDSFMQKSLGSPTSTLYARRNESPPISPCGSIGFNSVSELSESMRGLLIGNGYGGMTLSPREVQMGCSFGSTRQCSMLRPGYNSVPVTLTRKMTRSGLGEFDMGDELCKEESAMERVESGRDVRAKMYAKLRKENSLDRVDSVGSGVGGSGSLRSEI